jgi:Na+-driven multidrug efflux pump
MDTSWIEDGVSIGAPYKFVEMDGYFLGIIYGCECCITDINRESMKSKLRIRDASGWTMFIFGVLAALLGLVGLLRPEFLLSLLGFTVLDRAARVAGDYTLVFLIASSMASFNMGAYYVLASLHDNKQFYRWTVPFRCITPIVFTIAVLTGLAPTRFLGVAAWELTGAIATGIALWYEDKKEGGKNALQLDRT